MKTPRPTTTVQTASSRAAHAGMIALLIASYAGGAHARLDIGEKAPSVLLVEAGTGRGIDLAQAVRTRRLTVLAFVSTRCQASMRLDSQLSDARAQYAAQGVEMFAVHASGEDEREIAAHAVRSEGGPVALRDRDALLANVLGAEKMPEYFVLDDDGELVYRGLLHDEALLAGLDEVIPALLRGEKPTVTALERAPAVCGIRVTR
jgi:hypothetical protein